VGPSVAELPSAAQIATRQALIRNVRTVMPPLMLASVGSNSVVGTDAHRRRKVLAWLGFVCAALPIVITLVGNVPLNRRIAVSSVDQPPPG
jgi:hypothetical protein